MKEIEEYQLYCNDEPVACAYGPDAYKEILHYLCQYQQDGECWIEKITRKRIDIGENA